MVFKDHICDWCKIRFQADEELTRVDFCSPRCKNRWDELSEKKEKKEADIRLKRCPFCGSKKIFGHKTVYGYTMGCECGAQGPEIGDGVWKKDKRAMQAWNNRFPIIIETGAK